MDSKSKVLVATVTPATLYAFAPEVARSCKVLYNSLDHPTQEVFKSDKINDNFLVSSWETLNFLISNLKLSWIQSPPAIIIASPDSLTRT